MDDASAAPDPVPTAAASTPPPPPPGAGGGPAALYGPDFYAWALGQAEALRRLRGRADLPPDLDLENVIEEVESLGRSDLRSVESLLAQLFVHLIKLHALPRHTAATHWFEEAQNFQAQAALTFSPSMARALDLDEVWGRARRRAALALGEHGAAVPPLPDACPFTLAAALDTDAGPPPLRARLAAAVVEAAASGPPRRGRRRSPPP